MKLTLRESIETPAATNQNICPELLKIIDRCRATISTRILRLPVAKAKMGQATSTYWAAVKRGELPPPISISQRSVGWLESELDAVIAARMFATRTGRRVDMAQFVRALIRPLDTQFSPPLSPITACDQPLATQKSPPSVTLDINNQ